jgi:hypothetical protein
MIPETGASAEAADTAGAGVVSKIIEQADRPA